MCEDKMIAAIVLVKYYSGALPENMAKIIIGWVLYTCSVEEFSKIIYTNYMKIDAIPNIWD